MDNSQYTPRTLIPPIDRILVDNMKQSVGVTSGYNDTNPEFTIPSGKIISGSDGKVININSQGVATYYPTSDVYDQTSGERGIPGSGNFSVDKKSIPHMSYLINPSVMGYDENLKLYLNGKIRPGQSQGDEAGNMFAGVKTPGDFEYKGCSVMPLDGTYQVGDTPGQLQIIDVSYGSNCGNATGNRTQNVKDYISQNPNSLSYDISRNTINFGDPFGGCNKFMSVTYDCNGRRQTVTRDDGLFDSGASLNITCKSGDSSLSKCYYDALTKGLSYFGLGNVDSNTNMGTCYAGDSNMLNNPWQNPGIPIWKIDMRKAFNYQGNNITNFFLGRNNNAYFSENGIHTEGDWSFYRLCSSGKLPNANPDNAQAFASDWNDDTRAMFLANGNLYFFSFPITNYIPIDLRENPDFYAQNMIYSSGTQGQTLNVGWTDQDILTGVTDNILLATPNILGSLAIGQSIYSSDGKLRLKLNTDYSLVLYTGDPNAVGCNTDMSNNNVGYGGIAVNQINDANTYGEKNFGKLAYVNRLGSAYEYTDPSLFHYSDTYTSNPGYTINNIDSNKNATKYITPYGSIGISYDGSPNSIENCQLQCSKSGACVGTVVDNGNCYLLDAINNDDVVYKDAVKGGDYTSYSSKGIDGYDIASGVGGLSIDGCKSRCDGINGCVGFEYWTSSGNCYVKNNDAPPNIKDSSSDHSVYLKNMGQNQPIINLRVPEINKEGQPSYSVYPNNDLYGADLGSTNTNTANDCLDICNKTEGCYSVAFLKGGNGVGTCYPKTYKEPSALAPMDNIDAYIRNPEKIENPMEATYTEYPHHWINGYDVGTNYGATPQVKDCMAACNEKEECAGFEYWDWNGYCFLKSKDGIPRMSETDGGNAIYVKNPAPVGTSYLIPTNVNVVNPNKFANYNISGSPMTNTTHDVSLMPESITNNFLLTSSQLKEPNDKIVRETDRIIRESFTSTQMYQENDKYLSKLDDTLNNYKSRDHKLQPNIITLNKMVSNSSIQMRYLNIVYSILFIIVCILLVVAFTISL
jgi:hypothetical protein